MIDRQLRRLPRRELLAAAVAAPLGLTLSQPPASPIASVVDRWRAAYQRIDPEALLATLSPDLEFRDPTFDLHANGLDEMREVIVHGAQDIAAVRIVVEHQLECAPWIIARQEQIVTLKAPAVTVSVRGVSLWRIEGGLIREWHDYYDALGMQKQIKAAVARR